MSDMNKQIPRRLLSQWSWSKWPRNEMNMWIHTFKCSSAPYTRTAWFGAPSGKEFQVFSWDTPRCGRNGLWEGGERWGEQSPHLPPERTYPMEWDLQPGPHRKESRSSEHIRRQRNDHPAHSSAPKQRLGISKHYSFKYTAFLKCMHLTIILTILPTC